MSVLQELAKHAPAFIWGGLGFFIVWLFRKPISQQLLPRLSGFKAAGVEMSFVERSMEEAAELASHNNVVVATTVPKKYVEVTKGDRERALTRATRCADVLKGRRVLWLDDTVSNNRLERDMLEAFGVKIEQVQSNAAALAALDSGDRDYDLLLSDIARDPGEPTGIDFIRDYRATGGRLLVIFYISELDRDLPLPLSAFGLTNRPDELFHLVIDALERQA